MESIRMLNACGCRFARASVSSLRSFIRVNAYDKPLVYSPQDAVRAFLQTDLDVLVMGPFLVQKRQFACE